jgi:hypothetical protein
MPSGSRKHFVGGAGVVEASGSPFLVIEELAARWRLAVSGVRKRVQRGDIPADAYLRLAGKGRLLFKLEAIERLERESM